MMLYQVSEKSVSHNKKGVTYNTALSDLQNFFKYCANHDSSIIVRAIAKCHQKRFEGKKIYKYLNFPYYFIIINDWLHRKKSDKLIENVLGQLDSCQKHLDLLNHNVDEYINSEGVNEGFNNNSRI